MTSASLVFEIKGPPKRGKGEQRGGKEGQRAVGRGAKGGQRGAKGGKEGSLPPRGLHALALLLPVGCASPTADAGGWRGEGTPLESCMTLYACGSGSAAARNVRDLNKMATAAAPP